MKSRGFTLVELLVTIAIIIVLAGLSVPLVQRGLGKSRQAACLSKLRGIGVAVESYLQDNNRRMPPLLPSRESKDQEGKFLETELAVYLPAKDSFQCPADAKEFAKTGSSYIWNSAISGQIASQLSFLGKDGRPQSIPLVADKEAWHPEPKGTNILYADFTASSDLKFTASSPSPSTP